MKLRYALLAATIMSAPVAAMAQPVTGPYVSLGAGVNFMSQTNADIRWSSGVPGTSNPYAGQSGNIRSNGGFAGIGSVGWGFGNGFRAELELSWLSQSTRVGGFTNVAGTQLAGGGQLQTGGLAVNGFYDFNVGLPVVPFVGLGLGYGQTWLQNYSIYTPGSKSVWTASNSAQGGIMANAFLGAAYNITAVPGLALTAEYRFSGLFQNNTFSGAVTGRDATGAIAKAGSNGTLKLSDQYNNALLLGVRYAFNAPAPAVAAAPAPAPAPAPARSYLVFFDWDKADLTARAKQIIKEAADASTRVKVTKIQVNGHTDTTGSAAYNMQLSIRRAQNVAAELVANGVPKDVIAIKGFGFTHLLVPTGPNVREPQNRRVEIILE